MPQTSTPATPDDFRASWDGSSGNGPAMDDAEIQELARGLKYDSGLMYKFVHDHIHFDPTWGDAKGPYMTWMDRGGNAFDQASLMIALLMEAASHGDVSITNIKYVIGEIELTNDQFRSWFGLPDNVEIANTTLARCGLYGVVSANEYGNIDTVRLEHVWVKATIGGQTYQFDPSFKTHTVKTRYGYLGDQLYYSSSTFYNDAMYGADNNLPDYLKDVNKARIAQDLTTYSSLLRSHYSSATMEDTIGGRLITPVDQSSTPPSLPYTVVSSDHEFLPSAVKYMLRTTLRIQHCGIDYTFYSSDIYGRRLTLQYNGSNQPQLVLDGTTKATGNTTTVGQSYDLILSVDHPYYSSDFDESTTIKVVSGGFYQILNGWGNTGTEILKTYRRQLQQDRFDGQSDSSERVLGESYDILALTWLAQSSLMRTMAGGVGYSTVVNHHMVGVTGQTSSSAPPYISVPLGSLGIASYHTPVYRDTEEAALFQTVAGFNSSYEHAVIRQLQDCNAVSSVRLMDMANDRSTYDKIYYATSSNWSTVQGYLHNYSSADLSLISSYTSAGFGVYLPQEGGLTEQNWTGMGFTASKSSSAVRQIAYIVSGGNGGCASPNSALSVSTVFDKGYGANLGDSGDGAYTTGATDIAIGNGGYPYGLSFGRQYSSNRRLQDGPLGLGWTHSLDITALVQTDNFKFLGTSSPAEAAPQIAGIFAVWQLLCADVGSGTGIISMLSEAWVVDQMKKTTAVITQGTGKTVFAQDPNGSYIAPPGTSLKLVTNNGAFRLKNSSGIFNDFDSNGRLSEWSDAYGNKVDFTYTSGKLTQVAAKIGGSVTSRTLSFSYSGNHITTVTDSASRSVSYSYSGNELHSFTNLDSNSVTYSYHTSTDAKLTAIFSPISTTTPVVQIAYD
jgi:hypothetical protein